ncbi:MAG: chromosomal replication initiator protein DnaA [candidate division SR1 bacterium]|nr:MAG: chromosomal replication initiator protein DnaA [candidate division SR1 bacterium]
MYTFENYVTGNANNLAFSAAKAVAEKPGNVYNPLFLYGNVGLGKTHLMQAIGNSIMKNFPDKVVVYLPVVKLIDEIVMALRKNKIDSLIKKFAEIDVLMIDDAQFLANKDRTQEIFHNIFNEFHMQKKQIILSSDRPPKELTHIEPRLKSRFALGIVVDLKAPDYETRLAILEAKMEQKNEYIDTEVLSIIAEKIKNNVRELEGALNLLLTKKTLLGTDLTVEDANECLETLGYGQVNQQDFSATAIQESNTKGVSSYSALVDRVAEYYTITVADLKSDSRKKEIVVARQLLMILAKQHFKWTFEKIGDFFGGKNHASVIYAVNTIEKKIKLDQNIRHDYNVFVDWLE